MDAPSIFVYPSPSKLNSSLVSRSHSSTKNKFPIQIFASLPETPKQSFPPSGKIFRNSALDKELSRLEEELDDEEILISNHPCMEYISKKAKEKELNIYERYLDQVIHSILQIDPRLGHCMQRGWLSYKKTMHKGVKKIVKIEEIKNSELKETGVQADEIIGETDWKLQNYCETLNNLLKKIDTKNSDKLVHTLKQLLKSLKKIKVPTPCSTPEPVEIEYEKCVEISKAKQLEKSKQRKEVVVKKILSKLCLSKEAQTDLKNDDMNTWNFLKISITEKDFFINRMSREIKKFEEMEKNFKTQSKEFEAQTKLLEDFQETGCKYCKDQIKKLKTGNVIIRELKENMKKHEEVEEELEHTKSKLKDSVANTNKKTEKIQELMEDLDELKKRIEDVKEQRGKLEIRLKNEEELRKTVEKQLYEETVRDQGIYEEKHIFKPQSGSHKRENRSGNIINKAYTSKKNHLTLDEEKIISRIEKKQTKKYDNSSFSPKFANFLDKNPSPIGKSVKLENSGKFKQFEDKRIITQTSHSNKCGEDKFSSPKNPSKMKNMFKVLQISKEEFFDLPKSTKMELFDLLFAHKEKCGSNCEHLKRVQHLKSNTKFHSYPLKKYTITKD